MAIDVDGLAGDILSALRAILGEDAPKLAQLGAERASRLARQADWIAGATLDGTLNEEDRDWFLDDLARMAVDFARTLALHTLLTIERAWNAVVGTLWSALRGALGIAGLPLPALPVTA